MPASVRLRLAVLGLLVALAALGLLIALRRGRAARRPLASLPERARFVRRAATALRRERRRAAGPAVLAIEVEGLQLLHHGLGGSAGGAFAAALAARLRASAPPGTALARLGGDRFAVLATGVGPDAATATADRLAAVLGAPIRLGEREVAAAARVGIAARSSPADDAEDLLRRAELALREATRRGVGRVWWDAALEAGLRERLDLESDLRRAVERQELRVQYQPIVRLASGAIDAVEALVRWDHPRRGLLPPAEFIPLAEETGLIAPIGRWVLAEACRQVVAWGGEQVGRSPLTLAVNLSPRMLQHPTLVEEVAGILAASGLPPARLQLEITEGVLMAEEAAAAETLGRLKAAGVRVALDDFGVGYSSLAYLQRFPIDVLKLDRAFVAPATEGGPGLAIVRAILALARGLGLEVTGEGIETAEQLALLRELGTDRGQGYYVARPQPGDRLRQFLGRPDARAPEPAGGPGLAAAIPGRSPGARPRPQTQRRWAMFAQAWRAAHG